MTGGDTPEDIAAALLGLLGDEALARRLGATARSVAETEFDWPIVAGRIADEVPPPRRAGRLVLRDRAVGQAAEPDAAPNACR